MNPAANNLFFFVYFFICFFAESINHPLFELFSTIASLKNVSQHILFDTSRFALTAVCANFPIHVV